MKFESIVIIKKDGQEIINSANLWRKRQLKRLTRT